MPGAATDWVKLNVGGKLYHTTKQTLCSRPDTFLARLCSDDNQIDSLRDENGAILIDRNSEHFSLVLDFLRDGFVSMNNNTNGNNCTWQRLRNEALFYTLMDLVAICDEKIRQAEQLAKKKTHSIMITGRMDSPKVFGVEPMFFDYLSDMIGGTAECSLERVIAECIGIGYKITAHNVQHNQQGVAWYEFILEKELKDMSGQGV